MFFAWLILGFSLLGTNRWFTHKWKHNQTIHSVAGSFVAISTVVTILQIKELSDIKIGLHNVVDYTFTVLSPVAGLTGLATLFYRGNHWNTRVLIRFRQVHRILGRVLVLLAPFIISIGTYKYAHMYAEEMWYLAIVNIALALPLLGLFEL